MADPINYPREEITVLIVDDDKSQRFLMRNAMDHAGIKSVLASDGVEALDIFLQLRPDVVLMDVNMPELDGITACRRLRQLPGGVSVPILMVTGSDDYESIQKAYEAGATDFVLKPINLLLLSYRVKYILRAHKAIEDLSVNEAKLEKAYRIGHLGSWDWNLETNCFRLSAELLDIFGMQSENFAGTYEAFLELIHPEDRNRVEREIDESLQLHQPINLEYRIGGDDAGCFIKQEGNFVTQGGNHPVRATGVMQDISLRIKTEQQIRFLAFYDRLTGLPNFRLFKELLEKALVSAKRQEASVAVMFIDIENFKRINDTFGRGVGDEVLAIVAQRIKESVRGSDVAAHLKVEPTAARFGGDEFGLIIEDLYEATDAAVVARRVQQSLSETVQLREHNLYLNSRVGISLYPSDGSSVETLMKNADIALSRAMEVGRNVYQFYTAELNSRAWIRYSMEVDLRKALERDELFCMYQPQCDLSTGEVVGVEALVRWNHPEKGVISPCQIIEIAEDSGLILPIGEFVLRTACKQNMSWQESGYQSVRMAVNLSVAQLQDKDLLKKIEMILAEAAYPAELLELEITESVLMENLETGMKTMQDLEKLGIHLSIDDFGTGYSSLNYLKRLPVQTLKIDRSFVTGTPHNSDDNSIVTAIVSLARNLGLHIVAEGVEHEDQKSFLQRLNCDTVQGALISAPLMPDEIPRLLKPLA